MCNTLLSLHGSSVTEQPMTSSYTREHCD